MGYGIVLDLRMKENEEEITAEDLKPYENKSEKEDVVLLFTGASKKRGFNKVYIFAWPYVRICSKISHGA
jgi:kynurenine formamidase